MTSDPRHRDHSMPVVPLTEAEARSRRLAHEERVDRWVGPYLRRRSAAVAHPVEDFLFTYYSNSPAALRRWHPGAGFRVPGAEGSRLSQIKGYVDHGDGAEADPGLTERCIEQVRWIRHLLTATAGRPLLPACFGLHEWAMVYRQPQGELRHTSYPLRLGVSATDEVVESHRIVCTHFDAYRFFTPDAAPRNALRPSRQTQHEHDQPGCLHATMDLYKWAYKLSPLTSAELVADCFALALEVRLVDMRASPYDLSSLGVQPIAIETAQGKREYVEAQRGFAERAAPLRLRLIQACDRLSEAR